MIKNNEILSSFSSNLFWDVFRDDLDLHKNMRFIIQRVIEYGTLSDWKLIKNYYGLTNIGEEMQKVRTLDDISLSFISAITGIKKENFRCYTTKQSIPQHWNF